MDAVRSGGADTGRPKSCRFDTGRQQDIPLHGSLMPGPYRGKPPKTNSTCNRMIIGPRSNQPGATLGEGLQLAVVNFASLVLPDGFSPLGHPCEP